MKKIILVFIALFTFASCKDESVTPQQGWKFESEAYIVVDGDFLPIGEEVKFVGARYMKVGDAESTYTVNGLGRYVTSFSECPSGFIATLYGAGYVILTDCSGKTAKLNIK